jgi:hypothetical protein
MANSQAKNEYLKTWRKDNAKHIKKYRKQYYKENPPDRTEYHKWYEENYRDKRKSLYLGYKSKFFEMYGNQCSCCGESTKEFLTIEHIQGQIGQKKDSWAYRKATNEYRPDLYEVLCMNCNFSKGKYGYCPHQIQKEGESCQ